MLPTRPEVDVMLMKRPARCSFIRGSLGGALATLGAAVVVHHHAGAEPGHQEGNLAPDSACCAGYHRHPVLEDHASPLEPPRNGGAQDSRISSLTVWAADPQWG